jgi:hypothetical protein
MNKRYLYLIAALIWGIPGLIITIKGFTAYTAIPFRNMWWLVLITIGVITGFILMFKRIVDRYSALIHDLPDRTSIWNTFPLRGWILVIGMSCLGIALKFIPSIPVEFTTSFYSGLGPALLFAAFRFAKKAF